MCYNQKSFALIFLCFFVFYFFVFPGCAARYGDFEKTIHEAWNFERKRNYIEAINQIQKAIKILDNAKDKDSPAIKRNRIWVLLYQGRLLVKVGDYENARKIFEWVEENAMDYSDRGRALYEKGLIEEKIGNREEEKKIFLQFIKKYPEHGLCSIALKKIMFIVEESSGREGLRSFLESLLADALKTSFGDDILWELAKLEKKAGNFERAENYLLEIDKKYPYPKGGTAFDYLFLLAEMEKERGNYEKAIQWLRKVEKTGEIPHLIGSYGESDKAKTLLALGKIYLEDLHQPDKAFKEFMKLVKLDFKTSSDDGLWWASQALFSQGNEKEACDLLRKLVKKYEYSNFKRESLSVLQSQKCSKFYP